MIVSMYFLLVPGVLLMISISIGVKRVDEKYDTKSLSCLGTPPTRYFLVARLFWLEIIMVSVSLSSSVCISPSMRANSFS